MKNRQRIPVSAIVLTKNEQEAIGACIRSLHSFDEVFVVDSRSTDDTRQIAAGLGATVVDFSWDGKYPKKKEWSLRNLPFRNDWVLFVDADERPSEALVSSLHQLLPAGSAQRHAAYDLPVFYRFMGRPLKHGHHVVKRALVRHADAEFPPIDDLDVTTMWEVEGHYQPAVHGSVGSLRGGLIHDDPDRLFDYFSRHNRYSDWEAAVATDPDLRRQVNALRTSQGSLFARLPAKPIAFFVYSYLARAGFLDGRAGFDYAVALATYYWQIDLKVREARAR
ncbi:MAG: glycosyltransferase family 2 protein [Actinomycetota bacterium]|nr:MAG: glycosyltransferase family 2 protein [Actinomycetota bacterium]